MPARRDSVGSMATVLVIEDDQRLRFALSAAVSAAGHEVVGAESGEDAVLMLEQRDKKLPEAILLDLTLPGMSGGHLLQWLKHDPRTRKLPVVVITGVADVRAQLEVLPDRILSKPVSPEELAQVLQDILRAA